MDLFSKEPDLLSLSYDEVKEIALKCKKCPLSRTRTNVVFGSGPVPCDLMLIGEAPGEQEDLQGEPFVGRAGKILDDLLQSISLKRADVYICNILKCRPPRNRNPLKSEIEACTVFLDKQIENLQPKIICPLGNFATAYILQKYGLSVEKIGNVHGKTIPITNSVNKMVIIPLYHPAAAIYNPNLKKILEQDFTQIKKYI